MVLTLANGVFAGAEIAMLNVRKSRLRELAEKGSSAARSVETLRENPERLFATVQVALTVISSGAAAYGGAAVSEDVATYIAGLGIMDPNLAAPVALGLVVAGLSFLSLVLGELVPKSLALRTTERYALLIGPLLLVLSRALSPFIRLLTATSNVILRPFGDSTNFAESRHTREELENLIEEAADGTIDERVSDLATRALAFGDLTAWDVMIPKSDVVAIEVGISPAALRKTISGTSHTRIPVYRGELDEIIGYLSIKDLLPSLISGDSLDLAKLIRKPVFVPETKAAVDLLDQLKQDRLHMAFVVDETGGLCGLVTMDDLVEELAGEFFGEHHREVAESFKIEADGSVIAEGKAQIRDINRAHDWELPEDDEFSTVAGLAISLAGSIPEVGSTYKADQGYLLEVLDASGRRVKRLRIRPPQSLVSDASAD